MVRSILRVVPCSVPGEEDPGDAGASRILDGGGFHPLEG